MTVKSLLLASALAALPFAAAASDELMGAPEGDRLAGHEPDTYRYGAPLSTPAATTPQACEQACNDDTACAAWSLLPPAAEQPARCELKRHVGRQVSRPGAVSGIASQFQPAPPVALDPPADEAPEAPSAKPASPKASSPQPVMATTASGDSMPMIFRPNAAKLEGAPSTPTPLAPTPADKPEPAPKPQPAD